MIVRQIVKSFPFPRAAPGMILVSVTFAPEMSDEAYLDIIGHLDRFHRKCTSGDLFHLAFLGFCDGLLAVGKIKDCKHSVIKKNPAFVAYRCAYGMVAKAEARVREEPPATSPKAEPKPARKKQSPPSPLDALLRADVAGDLPDRSPPLDDARSPDEAWIVPDGMVAE